MTRKIVGMDTINPPGFEHECTSYLAEMREAAGFEVILHGFDKGRTNVVARRGGIEGKRPIYFPGHLDTVPLGNKTWQYDPFSGEIHDGKLYGRGTIDMKDNVAAMVLAALRSVNTLDGTPGVVLVLTVGEETGCEGGKA